MNEAPYGSLLRQLRISNGLTLNQLCHVTGVNRELIRRYEKGKAVPPDEALLKILSALRTKPESDFGQLVIKSVIHARTGPILPSLVKRQVDQKIRKLTDEYFSLSGQPRSPEAEYAVALSFKRVLNEH